MKISITSFVYFNYPLAAAIERIAAAGYDGVDVWGGRPHAYRSDLGPQEIASLKRLLQDRNLGIPSFIPAQFRYPTSLCSGNETIRQDSMAYIEDSIETAALLGAPIVSVCPGHSLFGQAKDEAWQRLRASLDVLCTFAAARGLRVALEPADRFETDLVQTVDDALRLVGAVGRDNLGIILDVGHSQVVGEPFAAAVNKLGSALYHVHVDDNMGQRDQHLVPGEGTIDFRSSIAALRAAGYDGYLAVELGWDYTVDPDPAVRQSAAYLRALLNQA
ncbi:MAG: sugar phosphate isomerase/epimerase [Chloroflexi bacterium]|nr:sugar phosphate isomerase/epimerase [Chloroflexota bacterium]